MIVSYSRSEASVASPYSKKIWWKARSIEHIKMVRFSKQIAELGRFAIFPYSLNIQSTHILYAGVRTIKSNATKATSCQEI